MTPTIKASRDGHTIHPLGAVCPNSTLHKICGFLSHRRKGMSHSMDLKICGCWNDALMISCHPKLDSMSLKKYDHTVTEKDIFLPPLYVLIKGQCSILPLQNQGSSDKPLVSMGGWAISGFSSFAELGLSRILFLPKSKS